jgi:uncharacterized membrane protein YdjX (TVP38/TMEM64 family)
MVGMERLWERWAYKNTTLLVLSMVVFIFLADTSIVHLLIRHIGTYGYLGSFVSGIFFVSTFTIAPASLVLFHLAQDYNPFIIAVTAGAGAVIGDLLIFRYFKDQIFVEFAPLMRRLKKKGFLRPLTSPYFAWVTPIMGALIIASPFPDEIGIGMMGLSKIKEWQFIVLTFILNALGILIIVLLAQS